MSQVEWVIEQDLRKKPTFWKTQIAGGEAVNWYYVYRGENEDIPEKYFVFNDKHGRGFQGQYYYAPSIEHEIQSTVMRHLGNFITGLSIADVVKYYIPYVPRTTTKPPTGLFSEAHLWQAISKLADLVHKLT